MLLKMTFQNGVILVLIRAQYFVQFSPKTVENRSKGYVKRLAGIELLQQTWQIVIRNEVWAGDFLKPGRYMV